MKYDAAAPDWPDRDRFVLSNGHASMLLYSHALPHRVRPRARRPASSSGSGVRSTPGHPEYRHTPGVEVTTGPLGQGFANGVGIGARRDATCAPGSAPRSSTTTCSCSAATATSRRASATRPRRSPATSASAASSTSTTTTTSRSTAPPSSRTATTSRSGSRAYGWHVVQLGEVANDLDALEAGSARAWPRPSRPSCRVLRSHIGYPSPKYTDTADAHGNPLGADEVAATKEILGLPPTTSTSPDDVLAYYREAGTRAARRRARRGSSAASAFRDRRAEPRRRVRRVPRAARACRVGSRSCRRWRPGDDDRHARACGKVLDAVVDVVPGLIAGGADLTGNTGMA